MKILMLTPDYPPNNFGGIGGYTRSLSKSLVDLDIEVHIVVMRCDYLISDQYNYYNDHGIHVYTYDDQIADNIKSNFVDRWTRNSIEVLNTINKIISNKNFDIIHTNDLFTLFILDNLRDKLEIPIINTIHGLSAPKTLIEDGGRRYGYYSSHGVITVSQNIANNLENRYGKIDNLSVIPLGINQINYSNEREKIITFAGRLIKDKGPDLLIEAFNILRKNKKYSDYKVLIAGEGPELNNLKLLSKKNNLENHIDFLGFISNEKVNELLLKSTIHVVPSRFEEPFGISAAEGMSNGAFTVVANRGGLVEFVKHKENGLVFEANNPNDLAEKLKFALDNKTVFSKCIKNAYLTAEKQTWDKVAKRTLEIYNKYKNTEYVSNRIR